MPIVTIKDVTSYNLDLLSKKLQLDLLSVGDNVTALAGGGQSGATLITNMTTRVTTVATAADSILLPAASPGLFLIVINAAAANAMAVFPQSGEKINALSANTALSIAANKVVIFVGSGSGQWHSILTA